MRKDLMRCLFRYQKGNEMIAVCGKSKNMSCLASAQSIMINYLKMLNRICSFQNGILF